MMRKTESFHFEIQQKKYDDYMDLLYLEGKEGKTHYVLIKDFNRLNYQFSKMKCKKHFCKHCLQCFYSEGDLENHVEDCVVINGSQAIELPKPYIDRHGVERIPSVYFQNHHKQLPHPFVIVADFECLTEKMISCTPSDEKSYTAEYQKNILLVVLVIKLFAVMIRSIQKMK